MRDKKMIVKLSEAEWSWIRIAIIESIKFNREAGFPTIAETINRVFIELKKQVPAPVSKSK
jgi:hypothetical protein